VIGCDLAPIVALLHGWAPWLFVLAMLLISR
jgi:hypothetical protein